MEDKNFDDFKCMSEMSNILDDLKVGFDEKTNIFTSIKLDVSLITNPNSSPKLSPIFNRKVLDFESLLDVEKNPNYDDIKIALEKDLMYLKGLNDIARENTLLSILEKYTSLIPADAPYNDVSYYQKVKFDWAIKRAGGEGNLAYAMFEVTGIYDYLFNIGKTEDDSLKMMRGRSYICLVISRAVLLHLLHRFKLPKCNVLDDGGELFGILIPKSKIGELKVMVSDIKRSLIRQFNGAINLLFTIKEDVTVRDLLDESGGLITDITEGLYENEFHLFDDVTDMLDDKTFKIPSAKTCKYAESFWKFIKSITFKIPSAKTCKYAESFWKFIKSITFKIPSAKTCKYCGRDYPKNEGDKCSMCKKEIDIGSDLPRARYLVSYVGKPSQADIEFFDTVRFKFCNNEDEVKAFINNAKVSYLDIATINSTRFIDVIQQRKNVSYSFITIGNAAPMVSNKIMSFDGIEQDATGAKYLSAMKLDADNFGKITSTGGFGNKTSLLRIATLSAYFKYFFQGYLTGIIESHSGYTVYCGGDDLFLIAPWNKMIDLAIEINERFNQFTGDNQYLSLSGGCRIFTRTTTIRQMQKMTEDALYISKKQQGKSRYTIFDTAYKWQCITEFLSYITKDLLDGTNYKEPFGNSLIYDLHGLTKGLLADCPDISVIPKIYYRLRKNSELLREDLTLYKYLIAEPKSFHFIANYCSLYTREVKS